MRYYKCSKCENLYCFSSSPPSQLLQCGAYAGTKKVIPEGCVYPEEVPVGCGGKMVEISEEIANLIVDSMR